MAGNSISSPRIYYLYPSILTAAGDWDRAVSDAASMGFDALLAGWAPDVFLAPNGHGAAERQGRLDLIQKNGLRPMIDLRVDRLGATGELARHLGLDAPPNGARDPRLPPAERNTILVPFHDPQVEGALRLLLTRRLADLRAQGVAGVRWLYCDRAPMSFWRRLFGDARLDDFLHFGWAPDASRETAGALRRAGFHALGAMVDPDRHDARLPGFEQAINGSELPIVGYPEAPYEARAGAAAVGVEGARVQAERKLWMAAALGDGLLIPMGFEFGAREPVSPLTGARCSWGELRASHRFDLSDTIKTANGFLAREAGRFAGGPWRLASGSGWTAWAVARQGGHGEAACARLVLANRSLENEASVSGHELAKALGEFLPLHDAIGSQPPLTSESVVKLRPAEVRVLEGKRSAAILTPIETAARSVQRAVKAPRLAIENVTPSVDGGRYPVKRTVGETIRIETDAFGEGHDLVAVALRWRATDEKEWRSQRMQPLGNDRWAADLPLQRVGRYQFAIDLWRDEFAIFRGELVAKHDAGLAVPLELEEGARLVARVAESAPPALQPRLKDLTSRLSGADDATRLDILLDAQTRALMREADPRPFLVSDEPPYAIESERRVAAFASWYELFPRSQSGDASRHGTFKDVIARLPAIQAMGFDVVYFPPIHPIGRTNRKGRNNSLKASAGDPGSPYAIGSDEGGHEDIHPELGSVEDFRKLVEAASAHGMELALDLAIQASPDHPWLKQHPEWFDWRPDGTIRYAENPPKKYEDIVNVDFYREGATPALWVELLKVVQTWVDRGVKLFRVDNPHTKPFPFWEWLIADIRARHPDVVFLSEAFTRPKVMYRLAKIGFSQSYTYFTWRNTKQELTEYLTELVTQPPKDFFRPHFFVNTHDINPEFLQNANRPAFLIRAVLATTLSGLWGMYNGFELCEGRPDAKAREYANSEKYELTKWDWDRPGNIIAEIAQLNRLRRENPALQTHLGLSFLNAYNDNILYFEKATGERDNVVLVIVNLDPHNAQEAEFELPLWKSGLPDHASVTVEDLMSGASFTLSGKHQRIRLDPAQYSFVLWRIRPAGSL